MIALFPSLRVGEAILYIADLALLGFFWQRGQLGLPVLIPCLAALVLIPLIVRLAAVLKHQKIVNILFRKLDPESFIRAYEPLMKRAEGKPGLESTLRNFLSTGYANKGDFETAIRLLDETPPVEGKQAVRGRALQLSNLCSVYLLKGDVSEAQDLLHQLEDLLDKDQEEQAGRDMQGSVTTLKNYIQIARGWKADEAYLRNLALNSMEPFFQVTNCYQLALAQIVAYKRPQAWENLKKVADRAPLLYIGQEAARRAEKLEQEMTEEEKRRQTPPSERIVLRPFLKRR